MTTQNAGTAASLDMIETIALPKTMYAMGAAGKTDTGLKYATHEITPYSQWVVSTTTITTFIA